MFEEYFSAESLFGASPHPSTPAPEEIQDDEYGVLGLTRSATWSEITRAHRRLVAQLHPDRFVGADEATRAAAERRVRDVNEAFSEIRRQRSPSRT